MPNTKSETKDFLDELLKDEKFKYDIENDSVYNAIRRGYIDSATRIAEDILGKYSQISGGGGVSSAAITSALGGAHKEMQGFHELVPELYDLAREMYDANVDEKIKKYEAALGYDAYLLEKEKAEAEKNKEDQENGKNEESDGNNGGGNNGGGNNETPKEDIKYPQTDFDDNYSEIGNNGLMSGGLAMDKNPKHEMDENVYEMTRSLISAYISRGKLSDAMSVYNRFKNSMSDAQRAVIEKYFEK